MPVGAFIRVPTGEGTSSGARSSTSRAATRISFSSGCPQSVRVPRSKSPPTARDSPVAIVQEDPRYVDEPKSGVVGGAGPVMALAQRAGLGDLVAEHVRIGHRCEGSPDSIQAPDPYRPRRP